MKEITRIHIAKVAYDVELDAKKDIQKYINALERYADDNELLDDIEIRITELLAERGVIAGGVITREDIAAVRAQLGEPSDFAPEGAGDIVVGDGDIDGPVRKLYRDRDSAILGGVLAGVARFFHIDPIWVRLVFIVLLIGSFGTASIIYLILWLVVPAARTAAEKLQMRGQPVTLESIKKLGEQEDTESPTAATLRRVVRYGAGVFLLVGAIGTLVATLFIGFGLTFGTSDNSPIAHWRPQETWWIALALGLFVLAGLLFASLCAILANALFRRQWTKRIGTAVVLIVAAGLVTFFSGAGTMWYGSWQENVRFNELRRTSQVDLSADFKSVKSLELAADSYYGVNVEYIVSDKPRYELDALPGVKPQIILSDDNTKATISLKALGEQERWYWAGGQPSLKIYGPALNMITMKSGQVHYYNETPQDTLAVTAEMGQLSLTGSYKTVRVDGKDAATLSLQGATIENLAVQLNGGLVEAGVVRSLEVRVPEACPANEMGDERSRVWVQAVSSGKLTYNDRERTAKFIDANCGLVSIGEKDYDERWEN